MAKNHNLFTQFNAAIKLSDEDRSKLIKHRNLLRKRMRDNFNRLPIEVRRILKMLFQSQGSFIMDTIIKPQFDDYDLDDGTYFVGNLELMKEISEKQLHEWVILSIDTHDEYGDIKDKPTCVRVQYKLGFHIDIPIYYFVENEDSYLAHLAKGYMVSGPVEFIEWFEQHTGSGFRKEYLYEYDSQKDNYKKWLSDIRKSDCQLRRIVRYLKAWADLQPKEMPCGLIMTILATNNYHPHERDDIALKETLLKIQSKLNARFECLRPTTPADENLFDSYPNKEFFMSALSKFVTAATSALEVVNYRKSSEKWREFLGDRFPLGPDEDDPSLKSNPMSGVITRNHKPYSNG